MKFKIQKINKRKRVCSVIASDIFYILVTMTRNRQPLTFILWHSFDT